MNKNKKNAILIVAESRTTYDFSFCLDKQTEYSLELINKVLEMKKLMGVDTIILASASPVSMNNFGADWNWNHVEFSWYNQALIEGYIDEKGNLINDDNALMGKCFYPEGYAELSKEDGFGKYKIIKHEQIGSLTDKTTAYIKELSGVYNIEQIVLLYDDGYSDQIIDSDKIKNQLNIPISYFIPAKPWCGQNGSITKNDSNNSYKIYSELISIEGVIDCFQKFNNQIDMLIGKLEEKPSEFYQKISESLTPEERIFILRNLKNKSCENCANMSCNVEHHEKIGLDESGRPQGENCVGWINHEIIGKSKVLRLTNIYDLKNR